VNIASQALMEDFSILLTARLLEPPPDVRLSKAELPVAVAAALRRAMAKNPADRFETAGQFIGELLLAPIPVSPSVGFQPVFSA